MIAADHRASADRDPAGGGALPRLDRRPGADLAAGDCRACPGRDPVTGGRCAGPACRSVAGDRPTRDPVTGDRRNAVDSGSASVWAAGAIAAILVVLGLILGLGAASETRHRAASAADLAALAAAAHAADGTAQACAKANWVADQMRVRITACRLDGWTAEVEVTARPPDLLLGYGSATARARAGPVD